MVVHPSDAICAFFMVFCVILQTAIDLCAFVWRRRRRRKSRTSKKSAGPYSDSVLFLWSKKPLDNLEIPLCHSALSLNLQNKNHICYSFWYNYICVCVNVRAKECVNRYVRVFTHYMYMLPSVCICVCTCLFHCIHMHIFMYMCIRVHLHVCIYVYMYICICVLLYMCVYMYMCTHVFV